MTVKTEGGACMERDKGIEEIVDAINDTSDPEKTLAILIAILKAAK